MSRRGRFYRIDDRTGFKVRASDTRKEWTGAIVHRDEWEPRHPQDFVRPRRDEQRVPDPRPDPEPVFQYPAGGPFFLVVEDRDAAKKLEVTEGQFRVYSGVTELSPSDL